MLPHEECCTDVGAQNGPVSYIRHASQTFRACPLISGGTMHFLWFPQTMISVCHCLGPPGHDPGAGQHVVTAAQRHTQQL